MSACPFAHSGNNADIVSDGKCPFSRNLTNPASDPSQQFEDEDLTGHLIRPASDKQFEDEDLILEQVKEDGQRVAGKCPLGYDSGGYKLGPLSCMLCRTLLHDTVRCVPCRHVFCGVCVGRFQDCPLCGADVKELATDEETAELDKKVGLFIEGHARMHRSTKNSTDVAKKAAKDGGEEKKARGELLLQLAMRAFAGLNFDSARHRLSLFVSDCRTEVDTEGPTPSRCAQLGAALGALGDCCQAMGDTAGAARGFEDSIASLENLEVLDSEGVHALSVSLNKLGDLRYTAEDLPSAKQLYAKSLNRRKGLCKTEGEKATPSQHLDVVTSLTKMADVQLALGETEEARRGFKEALGLARSLEGRCDPSLEQKRASLVQFLEPQQV